MEVDASYEDAAAIQSVFDQAIYSNIIDHLHDDKDALTSCTTVCKVWLVPASAHLFRSITWKHCFLELYGLLKSVPRIASALRTLQLTSWRLHGDPCFDHPKHERDEAEPLACEELLSILELTPHLDTLRLADVRWLGCWMHPPHAPAHRRLARTLDTVVLAHSAVMFCEDDLHWLACFTRIGTLAVEGCERVRANQERLGARVERLNGVGVIIVRDLLAHVLDLSAVRSVTFGTSPTPKYHAAFLAGIVNVEALDYPNPDDTFRLPAYPNLRALTVASSFCESLDEGWTWDMPMAQDFFTDTLQHLRQTVSGHIEELGIRCDLARDDKPDDEFSVDEMERALARLDWQGLVPILERCAKDCKLRVYVRCSVRFPDATVDECQSLVENVVEKALSDLQGRNRVGAVYQLDDYRHFQRGNSFSIEDVNYLLGQ
ncbi:hypothetical protein PsYK624_124560 [Phanerochaete sordida]|uniref:Uncharacterized protein n=1 Tax=Phanerochaete sordida TaxID=48140 RepID=A0A9P3GIM6_9APHY|nr:hypothetical protein PsYK624_124560 [Phanerochaete sordida]